MGDILKARLDELGQTDMGGVAAEDGSIVNIHVEASSLPCAVDKFEEG